MRIIAGRFRHRHLRAPRGMDVRPTSDKLRETLFNVLAAGRPEELEGSVWIDAFAGTGAVGIEALSRGARMVYFLEPAKQAAAVLRANLDALGLREGFEILEREAAPALREGFEILEREAAPALRLLEGRDVVCDFCFLDPPYRMEEAYAETLALLASSRGPRK